MSKKNSIIKRAIKFCIDKKHRLTIPRLEVLKIINSNSKPIKAYDILKKLGNVLDNPKPPTAYRAIEFWRKHSFIHRIESINAYSICSTDHHKYGGNFLICDDCGKVSEYLFELPEVIKSKIKSQSFKLSNWNLEINGVCKRCL